MSLVRNNVTRKLRCLSVFCNYYSTGPKEEKIKIGAHKINYLKVGNGAHSVIFTPGGLGTIWSTYKQQIDHFDRDKFTVVVWDPLGFGKSYPPAREFTSDSYEKDADTAHELMKMLGFCKYSVLGWSVGSSASLIHAGKYPDAVRKLVVWGANAYMTSREIQAYRNIRDIKKWAKPIRLLMEESYGKERFAEYWAEWVDNMSVVLEAKPDICTEFVKRVRCPTMVLHGAKDPLVDSIHPTYLVNTIKNSILYVYPDGKHEIHMRYAEDFNRRVQEFLLSPVDE